MTAPNPPRSRRQRWLSELSHSALLVTFALALASGLAAQDEGSAPGGEPGAPIRAPAGEPRNANRYGLFTSRPTARLVAPHRLLVEFQTTQPTPAATVYYGLSTLDEELDWPRYRSSARERLAAEQAGATANHRIELDFARLRQRLPNTASTNRIEWRIEVWWPARQTARYWEGRTHFDPATGGDTVTVSYGPFLDQVTETSALISWQTDRPSDGRVEISGRTVSSDVESGTSHTVRVDGLLPDTAYDYVVRSGTTSLRPYTLRTAGSDVVRFAAMVDSREGVGGGLRNFHGVEAHALRALSSHAYFRGVDFVLFAGDLINGYTCSVEDFEMQLDAWRRATQAVQARVPFYEGMGNHEALIDNWRDDRSRFGISIDKRGANSAEAVFARTFVNPRNGPQNEGPGTPTYQENVYWFDRGSVRVFVLNNNYFWSSDPHRHGGNLEGYVLPAQIAWLREQIAAADRNPAIEHLFFAAQEPPFPNGGHTQDAMWWSGGDTDRDGDVDSDDYPIVHCRNTLWSLIASSKKTVAFIAGDEHAYSRLWIGPKTDVGPRTDLAGREAEFQHGVWQVTAGGAGAPWYDKQLDLPWSRELRRHSTQPHYAMFEVTPDGRVQLDVFSQTGQRIDSAELRAAGK